MDKKLFVFSVCFLIVGFILGMNFGIYQALDWAVDKALVFAELNEVEIGMDSDMIAYGLWQYKNRIDVCYSPQADNALIRDYERNKK